VVVRRGGVVRAASAGEAEMARIQSLLRKLKAELYNGRPPMRLEWVAPTIEHR
jgi:hypothetical protein